MQVSVIIPAYNAEHYVSAACQSLVDQTESRFETIIVDDCSTDHTARVVQRLCERDARFKLIRLPRNGGPGAARNAGIAAASSPWIALLDADDTFAPNRLHHLLDFAARTRSDVVSDNLLVCEENSLAPERAMYGADRLPREMLLTATEYVTQNIQSRHGARTSFGFMQPMVRREFLQRNGISYDPHTRFGEDFVFAMRCLLAGASWWITPAALYRYIVRAGSLTEDLKPNDLRAISDMERGLLANRRQLNDAALCAALRRHKRAIDHWRYTIAFQAAIQKRDFREAFRVTFENRDSLEAVVRDTVANAPLTATVVSWLVAARSAERPKKGFERPVANVEQPSRQLKTGSVV